MNSASHTRASKKMPIGIYFCASIDVCGVAFSTRRIARTFAQFCAILRKSLFEPTILASAEKKFFTAVKRRSRRNFARRAPTRSKKICALHLRAHARRTSRIRGNNFFEATIGGLQTA